MDGFTGVAAALLFILSLVFAWISAELWAIGLLQWRKYNKRVALSVFVLSIMVAIATIAIGSVGLVGLEKSL